MNLPHKEPLLFAKKVLFQEDNVVEVKCEFKHLPTLAMFVEAAAQSSAVFNMGKELQLGFLSMIKEVTLLDEIKEHIYTFKLIKEAELNHYKQFSFEAYGFDSNRKVVIGSFTLVLAK